MNSHLISLVVYDIYLFLFFLRSHGVDLKSINRMNAVQHLHNEHWLTKCLELTI